MSKTIYWQYDGYETIHQAEAWCYEGKIIETRHLLGIPIWVPAKIIDNYELPPTTPDPSPELASDHQPIPVSEPVKQVKSKPKATKLPVSNRLPGHSDPLIS